MVTMTNSVTVSQQKQGLQLFRYHMAKIWCVDGVGGGGGHKKKGEKKFKILKKFFFFF